MSETLSEIEGKYEILEKLQVGGMGAIYKVRHRLLGDERVVKVMRPQLVHDPELQQRFHREARAATRLTHPNIARLYDFSVDEDGNAYIVMELIRGWTLDDLILRGELPPLGLTLEIADQSLRAIGHLHSQGVIHRDISPDNLMLTRDVDGRAAVKLIDLGLIKSLATSGNLTATGVFVGKFRYASPEQFGHGGTPGPPSDLYSFGLVLYELLTGRYPIVGKSASSLIAGHLFRPPLDFVATDLDGRVPDDLRQAVMRALAKEPEDRYPSAADFAAALAPIRQRHELAGDATRRILELIGESPGRPRPRAPSRGSTQSRFDRHFGREPTPSPDSESAAAAEEGPQSWVRRIEARIAANDFAAAREELRRAVEAEGETPELWEIGERIKVIEEITAPPAPVPAPPAPVPPTPPPPPPPAASPAREVEAELVEVEALRAAGRLEQALDKACDLRLRAPRHKLIRLVVAELEREIAAARPLPPHAAGPTEMLHNLRSQVEKELAAPADARRQARHQADEMVARARERATVEDFAGARDLLRRALELWPGHPEGLVLQVSVDACLQVQEEEARSEEELESTLRDIRDLVAAGKTSSALHGLEEAAFRFGEREELRTLQEEALRAEDEEDDEAALAMTTPLETRADDAAALAETELLPQVRRSAEPAPSALGTQPVATVEATGAPPAPEPPPPEPPPSAAPTAVLRRSFDEISLQIPQQPRPGKAAGFDDLTLSSVVPAGPSPRSRTGRRTFWTAVVVVAVFLAIGLGLSGVLSWPGEERTESVEVDVSRLLEGLATAPSAPLRAAAEALLAGDFERTLEATAAGSFAEPREEAWAHLLRAAACHALYVRGGEEDPSLRERTLEEIRAGRAADAGVVPGEGFSPSFRDLVASTR